MRQACLATCFLLGTLMAGAQTSPLFTSGFDGNTGAVVLPGNTDNTNGSASLAINDWTKHASVTVISGLTAISTGDSGTFGGFVLLQNGAGTYANSNCVFLSRNHNLDTNRITSKRGFSLTFTLNASQNLAALTVLSGHANNTGADQVYASTLVYSLSGGTLGAPVTGNTTEDYGIAPVYHTVTFNLAGTTLGPGTYMLEVYQRNMTSGGAYAIYNGVTLTCSNANPAPAIQSFTAQRSYVAAGSTVNLSWQTTGATTLAIVPGVGDVTALTTNGIGTTQIVVNQTTTFTLSTTNSNGSTFRNVEVAVGPSRPNLVVILADDYGPHDTSVPFNLDTNGVPKAYNFNSFYKTPNLERLAAQGMRFTSAYAQSVCSPTRTGMMTGRNSARHAVTDWVGGGGAGSPTNWRSAGMVASEISLPKLLKAGGYRTIHIGKGHFSDSTVPVTSIGFDVNVGGFDWGHPHSGYIGTPGYGGMPGLEAYDGSIFLTRALTIEANKTLDNAVAEGRPFFLNMSFYAVHAPFTTNPDATNTYSTAVNANHAKFATMVEGMDNAIGQIRQKLVDLGVAENTLIIFLGDNGSDSPATTQDGLPLGSFSDWPMRGMKGSKWEGGIRVPMIACWAAVNSSNTFQQALPIPTNSVETDIVTSWDVPVTLLGVTGLAGAVGFGEDGHDLRPYLAGIPGTHRPQEILIHYPHNHRSDYFTLLRQGSLKLIYNYQDNSHQLYDLASDPTESTNLAVAQPETLTRMARTLAQKLAGTWGPAGVLKPTIATTAPNGNVVSIPDNPSVDVDHDGLADTFEDPDLNGLVATTETDPDNSDTDGDHTPDGAELRTGTNPLAPASNFLGKLTRYPGGDFTITWPSKPGATYEIYTSENLTDWSAPAIASVSAHPSGTNTTYTLPPTAGSPNFYRVLLMP